MTSLKNSFLFNGSVRHRRLMDVTHEFQYSLGMVMLDINEVRGLPSNFLRYFRRADYLGPSHRSLRDCVLDRVEEELFFRPCGDVQMLTQLRSFGYQFNPVTFYFCFGGEGKLEAFVAEITNTPWAERFSYVLDARTASDGNCYQWSFDKLFHVSPFHPMDHVYEWVLTMKGADISISMANYQEGKKIFDVSLVGSFVPLTRNSLCRQGMRSPLQSMRMHAAIYWHALRLFVKRAKFYVHPDKLKKKNVDSTGI